MECRETHGMETTESRQKVILTFFKVCYALGLMVSVSDGGHAETLTKVASAYRLRRTLLAPCSARE